MRNLIKISVRDSIFGYEQVTLAKGHVYSTKVVTRGELAESNITTT